MCIRLCRCPVASVLKGGFDMSDNAMRTNALPNELMAQDALQKKPPLKKDPNPIDRHVGNRVRMRRIVLGISQQKLGAALDVSFQQVQKYEKGSNRIGASRLQDISRILEVAPAYFFDGAAAAGPAALGGFAEEKSSDYVVDFISTTEGLHLNRAFARIRDPKVRRHLVELIVATADSQSPAL